jgi:hypothetical protein
MWLYALIWGARRPKKSVEKAVEKSTVKPVDKPVVKPLEKPAVKPPPIPAAKPVGTRCCIDCGVAVP